MALSITCNVWAAPEEFNNLSQATSVKDHVQTPLLVTLPSWKANQWFSTKQQNTTENIEIKVTLNDVPKRDPDQRDDKDFYNGVDVYGGYGKDTSDVRTIQGNSVDVRNKTGQFDNVFGGMNTRGKVQNNSVTIQGDVYQVVGGESFYGDASTNTVIVKDSNADYVEDGTGMTGSGNLVIIENSTKAKVFMGLYLL